MNLNWDEPVPECLAREFSKWIDGANRLHELAWPRHLGHSTLSGHSQLVIFSDASFNAVAAVAYVRNETSQGVQVRLVMAKTKIAPKNRELSIVKLELISIVLACRLGTYIKEQLRWHEIKTQFLSDSKIALAYVSKEHTYWKEWVSRRVRECRSYAGEATFMHVGGHENPADLASRGVDFVTLRDSEMWRGGPDFLMKPVDLWPVCHEADLSLAMDERAKPKNSAAAAALAVKVESKVVRKRKIRGTEWHYEHVLDEIACRCSNYEKAVKVIAIMLRWKLPLREHAAEVRPQPNHVDANEFAAAEAVWIRHAQSGAFSAELRDLRQRGRVSASSRACNLRPYLDKQDILRVGGRLEKAKHLTFDQKHSIILPQQHKSRFVKLLALNAHEKTYHCGIDRTNFVLRERYYLLDARKSINEAIKSCMLCKRLSAQTMSPEMSQLPNARVEMTSRNFERVGLDLLGPVFALRAGEPVKMYVALFVI